MVDFNPTRKLCNIFLEDHVYKLRSKTNSTTIFLLYISSTENGVIYFYERFIGSETVSPLRAWNYIEMEELYFVKEVPESVWFEALLEGVWNG